MPFSSLHPSSCVLQASRHLSQQEFSKMASTSQNHPMSLLTLFGFVSTYKIIHCLWIGYLNTLISSNPATLQVALCCWLLGMPLTPGASCLGPQLEQLLRVQPRSNPNAINYPKEIAIFIGVRCYEGHMFTNPQMGVVHCCLANIVEKHVWHCVALIYIYIYHIYL